MLVLAFLCVFVLFPTLSKDIASYQPDVDRIIAAALTSDHSAWETLAYMCDTWGNRILGSPQLNAVVNKWLASEMTSRGFANVREEVVTDVPYWLRGEETAEIVSPHNSHSKTARRRPFRILGLGGSISGEVTADAIVVRSKEELDLLGEHAVKGKIVIYDVEWESYGSTVAYRSNGGAWASKYGAVGALMRSATPFGIYTPHTGSQNMNYSPRILTACIPYEDAHMFARMQKRGEKIRLHLKMESTLTYVNATNVIGEYVGSTYPEKILLLGGHIDTWDVGVGAMDDGGGVVTTMEAVHTLIRLGMRPKRTLRVIAFAGEEWGGLGGQQYFKKYETEMKNHILALESDMGNFVPYGFGFSAPSKSSFDLMQQIVDLQSSINATTLKEGGGGTDIGPICSVIKCCAEPLTQNDRYFWYHHTEGDRMDVLDEHELDLNVASIASMIYVVADMDQEIRP